MQSIPATSLGSMSTTGDVAQQFVRDDHRAIIAVVGGDPYAWKGYDPAPHAVDIRPHSRPAAPAADAPTPTRQAP